MLPFHNAYGLPCIVVDPMLCGISFLVLASLVGATGSDRGPTSSSRLADPSGEAASEVSPSVSLSDSSESLGFEKISKLAMELELQESWWGLSRFLADSAVRSAAGSRFPLFS